MRVGLRVLLGYFVVVALAAVLIGQVFVQEIKPGVRQAMEEGATNPTDKSTSQLSQRDRSNSSATRDTETSSRSRSGVSRMQADRTTELTRRRRAGIQARDYAQSAHRHINGGRAVTAGNA